MKKHVVTKTITPSKASSKETTVVLKRTALVGSPITVGASGTALLHGNEVTLAVRSSDSATVSTSLQLIGSAHHESIQVDVTYYPDQRLVRIIVPQVQKSFEGEITFTVSSDLAYTGFFFNSDKSKTNAVSKVFIVKNSFTIANGETVTVPFNPIVQDDAIPSFIAEYSFGDLTVKKIVFNRLGNIVVTLKNDTGAEVTIPDESSSISYPYFITAFCFY